MRFLLVIFALLPITANAQKDTSAIFTRFYFPFSFGYALTQNSNTYTGTYAVTGLEYRFSNTEGLFSRFDFDTRKQEYNITCDFNKNISEGKLEFNDYLIGIGSRFSMKKLKYFGLIQCGISSHKYLIISGPSNDYKSMEQKKKTSVVKGVIGFEYYFADNAAFTIETGYTIIPAYSVFWNNHLDILDISAGLTTTLF